MRRRDTQHSRRPSLAAVLAAVLCLAGCKEELYTGLEERDANTALTVLGQEGIDANKSNDGKTWSISVEGTQTLRAMKALRNHGLPPKHYADLGELFKPQGMVSTPTEERMRYIYGVSQQLARSLRAMDGVLEADVHVVMPVDDPLSDVRKPSRAAVFIKYNPDADLAPLSPSIKELVAHGVEGLTEANVALTLVPALPQSLPTELRTGDAIRMPLNIVLTAAVFLLGLLVGGVVVFLRAAGGLRGAVSDIRLALHARRASRVPPAKPGGRSTP
jgi:type III secretion protein J